MVYTDNNDIYLDALLSDNKYKPQPKKQEISNKKEKKNKLDIDLPTQKDFLLNKDYIFTFKVDKERINIKSNLENKWIKTILLALYLAYTKIVLKKNNINQEEIVIEIFMPLLDKLKITVSTNLSATKKDETTISDNMKYKLKYLDNFIKSIESNNNIFNKKEKKLTNIFEKIEYKIESSQWYIVKKRKIVFTFNVNKLKHFFNYENWYIKYNLDTMLKIKYSFSLRMFLYLFYRKNYKNKKIVFNIDTLLSLLCVNIPAKKSQYEGDRKSYFEGNFFKKIYKDINSTNHIKIKKYEYEYIKEYKNKKLNLIIEYNVVKNSNKKDLVLQNDIKDTFATNSELILKEQKPISPSLYTTLDHHKVRSRAEAMIDDFLYHHNIMHSYEKRIIISWETIVCDFYLPQYDVYVEFWWMDDEKYLKRKEEKIKIYKENNFKLIWLENKDLNNLEESLLKKLKNSWQIKNYKYNNITLLI